MSTDTDPEFEALLAYLKEQRGFDFTGYKRASLVRRVSRRMETVHAASFEDYQEHLETHPDEFTTLFNTILINVTGFFRDADAWAYLRSNVLPDLLAMRDVQPIRVWSAGCASGEEAFTLAILFAEALGLDEFRERVKIYATDVDEDALATARQATFSDREMRGVPDDLREKYFDVVGQRCQFRKELRRAVIFGRNDLVQDAPISHVDLLTCRNTLMYFNAEAQAQILQRLHFALRPDGVLFLGKAEMLLSHAALFRPVELKRRFFQKVPNAARDRRAAGLTGGNDLARVGNRDQDRLLQEALMSSAAAQIVLDTDGRIALCNHRAGQLFGLSARDVGRPIQDLELSYRPLELRSHLDRATAERRSLWIRDVTWTRGASDTLSLDIQVVPLIADGGAVVGTTVMFTDNTQYHKLQEELEYANRQLETAYEELQSTNEELETTNEELQSTNEELETMNEELQSMNDELHVSNEGLRERQDEVDHLNRFMSGVLGGMNAGVVVVDRDLMVTAWNTKADDLWGVRADEAVGTHLLNLDIGLPVGQLRPLLKEVLGDSGRTHEATVLDAVNRRGRPVAVQVTVSPLASDGDAPQGAIMVMDARDR